MEKLSKIINDSINEQKLQSITFSSPRQKANELKSVYINNKKDGNFKLELRLAKHNDIKDIPSDKLLQVIEENYLKDFKQILIKTQNQEHQALINKKLKAKLITKTTSTETKATHNRKKNYIIPDGVPCDFLIEIGVMAKNGKVKSNYYKKFKQINRFLEMVDDLFKKEQLDKIHAVDFGSGKSYLTFAIYHYFKNVRNIETKITGIDLKQEVIDNCNTIAQKLNYSGLNFVHGFIHDFKTDEDIDFVVTLHACDTATDEAILFSLKNNANKMIFVPCCQHELNSQLNNKDNNVLIEHGVYRDKMCAIITDNVRAKLLEASGYKVQIMEFIETEHTAKNIMLRCQKATKSLDQRKKALEEYNELAKKWSITPYLAKKLDLEKSSTKLES